MKKLLLTALTISALAVIAEAQFVFIDDVRKVDFTNFTFSIEKKDVKIKDGLQDNACREKNSDGDPVGDIWNVSSEAIAYGDLDGDAKAEAIVPLVANTCGGNMLTNEAVLVYKVKDGKYIQFPVFDYFDEGCAAGTEDCNLARVPGVSVSYDNKTKALVVANSFAADDDAICCPSFYRETWFKWNGTQFIELKKGKITRHEGNDQ